MLVLCLEIYKFQIKNKKTWFKRKFYYQDAKIKEILLSHTLFQFSKAGQNAYIMLKNHETEPLYAYRRYAYKKTWNTLYKNIQDWTNS